MIRRAREVLPLVARAMLVERIFMAAGRFEGGDIGEFVLSRRSMASGIGWIPTGWRRNHRPGYPVDGRVLDAVRRC
ncbi:MAG: hypothetical protein ACKO6B_01275, partial [Planctomycetia bacterium]